MPPDARELRKGLSTDEPPEVTEARRVVAEWERRLGHDSYVEPLDGGFRGYQARCWDCDWRGPEHLRGDEDMSTPESRAHKQAAKDEAFAHQIGTRKPTPHGFMHHDGTPCFEPAWCNLRHYKTPEEQRA